MTVTQLPGSNAGTPLACEARFDDYPANPTAPRSATPAPLADNTLYVAADGTGDFYSIQRALDAAPDNGATLLIAPGTYRESISITKPNIELRGSDPDAAKTIIVFDKSAGTSGGTLHSATAEIRGRQFPRRKPHLRQRLERHSHPSSCRLAGAGRAGHWRQGRLHQCSLSRQSGHALRGQPQLRSRRRALHSHARQYFTHCYIEGNVDFIFGDSKAVFDHCEIHSTSHSEGFLTAQSMHYPTEDSGFVFNHCTLTAAPGRYQRLAWTTLASLCESHFSQHRDGRSHRSRGLARVAPRRDPFDGNGLLRRIQLHRPRSTSRASAILTPNS